jgi:hypothetical protein
VKNTESSKIAIATALATTFLAVIYALVGFLLFGCATCTSKPMEKPWNFPNAEEWNKPFEFSWQNAVDNWRNLTVPRKKTINGLVYEYDEVTQLYFPNLMKLHRKESE